MSANYEIKDVSELNERENSLERHTNKISRAMFDLMMSESERMGYKNLADIISIVTNSVLTIVVNTATSLPESIGRKVVEGTRDGLSIMLERLESSDFDQEDEVNGHKH